MLIGSENEFMDKITSLWCTLMSLQLRFLEGQVELDDSLWNFFFIVQETQRLRWILPNFDWDGDGQTDMQYEIVSSGAP